MDVINIAAFVIVVILLIRWWLMPVNDKRRDDPPRGRGGGREPYTIPPPFVDEARRVMDDTSLPIYRGAPDNPNGLTQMHPDNGLMHNLIDGGHTWRPQVGDQAGKVEPEAIPAPNWPVKVKR